MHPSRVDPDRTCAICKGPLHKRNTIGICWLEPDCKKVAKAVYDGRSRPADRARRDAGLIGKSRIFDPVAVEIAISGERKVRMTTRERKVAARALIRQGEGITTIAGHLDMSLSNALILIDQMGYEIRPGVQRGTTRNIVFKQRRRKDGKYE